MGNFAKFVPIIIGLLFTWQTFAATPDSKLTDVNFDTVVKTATAAPNTLSLTRVDLPKNLSDLATESYILLIDRQLINLSENDLLHAGLLNPSKNLMTPLVIRISPTEKNELIFASLNPVKKLWDALLKTGSLNNFSLILTATTNQSPRVVKEINLFAKAFNEKDMLAKGTQWELKETKMVRNTDGTQYPVKYYERAKAFQTKTLDKDTPRLRLAKNVTGQELKELDGTIFIRNILLVQAKFRLVFEADGKTYATKAKFVPKVSTAYKFNFAGVPADATGDLYAELVEGDSVQLYLTKFEEKSFGPFDLFIDYFKKLFKVE